MKPMSELPEYIATWKLVHGTPLTAADRDALPGGRVRAAYLAAVVADVVQQAGSFSGTANHRPIALQTSPESAYILEYADAIDHGMYEQYRAMYESLWDAAVQYAWRAWGRKIHGIEVSWES